MGKGSTPRSNHSKEWFANYDDIEWNSHPGSVGLTDKQIVAYYEAAKELKSHGLEVTRFDEDRLEEAVKHDIKE